MGAAPDPAAVDPAFTRSVARWLRAYPRRWRAARAAEITAVLTDLAPEGATRLDLRSGLGLVRAGWATRWREHPPPSVWFRYAVLERPIDPRYRAWVRDDLAGWVVVLRRLLLGSGLLATVLTIQWLLGSDPPDAGFLMLVPSMYLLGVAASSRRLRRRVAGRQLVVQPGEVVTQATLLPGLVARRRIDARSWLGVVVVLLGVVLLCSAAMFAAVPRGLVVERCGTACLTVTGAPVTGTVQVVAGAAVVGAALVGLALARVGVVRLRRRTPVGQPFREVVPLGAHGRVRVVLVVLGLLPLGWAVPSLAVTIAGPAAVLAAGALPVLVAARRAVRRGEVRLDAGVDVWRTLVGARLHTDRAVDGHMPASSWLPVGAVVPPPAGWQHPVPPGTVVATRPR